MKMILNSEEDENYNEMVILFDSICIEIKKQNIIEYDKKAKEILEKDNAKEI